MQLQTVNRSDAEKVFVNVTNYGGQTATNSQPVFAFTSQHNASSVNVNAASSVKRTVHSYGSFVGLADEDIANNAVGRVQVYGYKASCLIAHVKASGTDIEGAGTGVGPNAIIASLGLCSLGALSPFGPVVLLETVAAATLQGGAGGRYTNHVFIRAL